ncbi:MAG: RyR domain-containing protein [Planctomycetota bacterium]
MENRGASLLRLCLKKIRYYSGRILIYLAVITVVLAFFGTLQATSSKDPNVSMVDWITGSIYESVQALFGAMAPHRNDGNLLIAMARMTAVTFIGLLALKAVITVFRDSFVSWRLDRAWRDVVLVSGLGEIGDVVAQSHLEQREIVIAFESDVNHPSRGRIEELGGVMIVGSPGKRDVWDEHMHRLPKKIFLVHDDDRKNISAYGHVHRNYLKLMEENKWKATEAAPKVYFHLSDPSLAREMYQHLLDSNHALHESNSQTSKLLRNTIVFDIYENNARQFILDQLTAVRPSKSNEVALYVIVGFEKMGHALLRQIALNAHFENEKRPRILVLTRSAEKAANEVLAEFGQLSPRKVCHSLEDVQFDPDCDEWNNKVVRPHQHFQVDAEIAVEYVANVVFCEMDSNRLSGGDIAKLVKLGTSPEVKPAIMYCYDDELVNLKASGHLSRSLATQYQLEMPLFAYSQNCTEVGEVTQTPDRFGVVRLFGNVNDGLKRLEEWTESIAANIAWRFMRVHDPEKFNDFDSFRPTWDVMPYWEKITNLAAAEHVWLKVQLLGYRIVNPEDWNNNPLTAAATFSLENVSEDAKKRLARVEHNRWMAERLMSDWQFGPESDFPPRRSSLCAYQDLEETEFTKNFEQIEAVVDYLIQTGFRLEQM